VSLAVDNSSLNGESEECKKFAYEDYNGEDVDGEVAITGDVFVDKSSLFEKQLQLMVQEL